MIVTADFAEVQENEIFIYENKAFKRPDNSNRAIDITTEDVWEFDTTDEVMRVVK